MPPAEDGARLAREALVAAELELVVGAAERAAEPGPPAGAQEHGQVEVEDVPAGDHVGIGARARGRGSARGARARRARPRRRRPARAPTRSTRSPPAPADGDRVEALRRPGSSRCRSDRTRSARREVGRRERRVAVDAADARAALERAVDGEGAADAAVDQVAVGEAEVGLEALDAGVGEAARAAAARRRGSADLDARRPARRRRCARSVGDDARARREPRDHRGGVGGAHEEVGRQAVVDDERGLAALEDGVEVHLGTPGDDAVGRASG